MKTKKRLYRVTLPWPDQEGDYSTKIWAISEAIALLQVAGQMADIQNHTLIERRAYIKNLVDSSSPYSVCDIEQQIKIDLHDLLAGPSNNMPPHMEQGRNTILHLIKLFSEQAK